MPWTTVQRGKEERVAMWQDDLAYAVRSTGADPAVLFGIIPVSVIGISLSTALFTLADPFVSRPLPYRDPDRLIVIRAATEPGAILSRLAIAMPTLDDWRARHDLFEGVTAYGEQHQAVVRTAQGAALLKLAPVDGAFFDVLGPSGGGPAGWSESAQDTASSLAMIAGSAGSIAAADDSSVTSLDGRTWRVAGALPAAFLFPSARIALRPDALERANLSTVLATSGSAGGARTDTLTVIARVRPGVTAEHLSAALAPSLAGSGIGLHVEPLVSYLQSDRRQLGLGALAAGLLIVLVGVANLGNLHVARAMRKSREWALRSALGASASDLRRLVCAEAVVFTIVPVALSLVLAPVGISLMWSLIPSQYVALGSEPLTLRSAAFALTVGAFGAGAGALVGSAARRTSTGTGLHARLATSGRGVAWLRLLLVAAQCAIATILLVCGALLARSYVNLWSQDIGFGGNVLTVSVSERELHASAARRIEHVQDTIRRLRRIPGALLVGASVGSLLDDSTLFGGTFVTFGDRRMLISPREITPEYFAAVGATLKAGRPLLEADRGLSAVVANEAFVRSTWPSDSPSSAVGRMGTTGQGSPIQVVGVVADMRDQRLDIHPTPRLFKPLESLPPIVPVHYAIRLQAVPSSSDFARARAAVVASNPGAVILAADGLMERLAHTVRARTFATTIAAIFTVAAVGITAAGLAGLVAFVVAARTREIAIRVAIGAQPRQVLWFVGRQTTLAACGGACAGLAAGAALSRYLQAYLYGLEPGDPGAVGAAALLIVGVVVAAVGLAARRALAVTPVDGLRVE